MFLADFEPTVTCYLFTFRVFAFVCPDHIYFVCFGRIATRVPYIGVASHAKGHGNRGWQTFRKCLTLALQKQRKWTAMGCCRRSCLELPPHMHIPALHSPSLSCSVMAHRIYGVVLCGIFDYFGWDTQVIDPGVMAMLGGVGFFAGVSLFTVMW